MKYFHIVILIDKSVAMSDRSWELALIIMSEIIPSCIKYDRDGVGIYFLNHGRSYVRLHSAQDVANVFCKVGNDSVTQLESKHDSPYNHCGIEFLQVGRSEMV
ncbi:hypothetical protein RUND412_011121 [Rhizina undulata]